MRWYLPDVGIWPGSFDHGFRRKYNFVMFFSKEIRWCLMNFMFLILKRRVGASLSQEPNRYLSNQETPFSEPCWSNQFCLLNGPTLTHSRATNLSPKTPVFQRDNFGLKPNIGPRTSQVGSRLAPKITSTETSSVQVFLPPPNRSRNPAQPPDSPIQSSMIPPKWLNMGWIEVGQTPATTILLYTHGFDFWHNNMHQWALFQ